MLALPSGSSADEISTNPLGFYAVKIAPREPDEPPARTYVGPQLLEKLIYAANVESVEGNAVTMPSAVGSLDTDEREYFLQVTSGSGEGFIAEVAEFTGSQIVCTVDMEDWVTQGTLIRVALHPRLKDIFGADNRFGLGAAEHAEDADNVVIWDAAIQQERVFFYHSINGRWQEKDLPGDANDAVLRYPLGFYIVRRSSEPLRIGLSGEIASQAILLPIRTGANVFSLPLNLTASLQNLVAIDGEYGVRKAASAVEADVLMFEEPSTGVRRGPFYFRSDGDTPGWREIGVDGSQEPSEPLDMLASLVIQRSGPDGFLRVFGNENGTPSAPIPADPDDGELPLMVEFPLPAQFPPDINWRLETSTDLVIWQNYDFERDADGRVFFTLPAGQSRAFYRLTVSLIPTANIETP